MKRLLTIAAAVLVACAASARADSTTTVMGLTLPTIGSTGWATKLNTNFNIIDSTISQISASTQSFANKASSGINADVTRLKSLGSVDLNLTLASSFTAAGAGQFGIPAATISATGSLSLPVGASVTGLGSSWISVATGAVTQGKFGDDRVAITTGGVTGGFNAASQLVQMTGGGLYPTASGANITSLTPGNVGAGVLPSNVIASSVAAGAVTATQLDTDRVRKTGDGMTGPLTLSGSTLTVTGAAFSVGGSNLSVDANQFSTAKPATVSAASTTIRNAGTTDLCLDNNATGTQAWNIRAGQVVNGDFSIGYRSSGCTGTYTPVMLSSSSGNTGFGTTSPLATLSVAGTFSGTGAATFGSSTTVNGAAQFGSGVAVTSFTATGFLIPTGWTSTQLSPAGAAPAPGSIGVMTRNSTINDMCISTGTAAGQWALFGSKGTGGCF